MIAPASGKEIFAHRESGDTLHTYVALSKPQDWFAAIDFTDAATATARIATHGAELGKALAAHPDDIESTRPDRHDHREGPMSHSYLQRRTRKCHRLRRTDPA